jgi:hypothetical protein
LPPETRAELNRVIDHDVMGRFSEGGGMTGEQAQEIGTTLDNLADRLRVSEFPDRRRLSGAIREIDATINRMMERNNPTLSLEKARIDLANAHYKTMEAASGMLGAKDGLVLPAQLSHAIKSRDGSKDKSDYARGFALMQDFAANAERTLNRQLPDSGTPERLFWRELTKELAVIGGLAGGAHAAGTPSQDILAASAGLGLAALPYTEPGLAAARALANPGAGRKAVRQGLEGIAPYLAPGAGAAAAGLGVGP